MQSGDNLCIVVYNQEVNFLTSNNYQVLSQWLNDKICSGKVLTKSCKARTCLTHDTASTAQRGHRISHLVSLQTMITPSAPSLPLLSSPHLNVVSLSRLCSGQHDGDAGDDTAQDRVQDAGLAEVFSSLVVQTPKAEWRAATWGVIRVSVLVWTEYDRTYISPHLHSSCTDLASNR